MEQGWFQGMGDDAIGGYSIRKLPVMYSFCTSMTINAAWRLL